MISEILEAVNLIRGGDVAGIGAALMVAIRLYRQIPGAPWPDRSKVWIVMLSLGLAGGVAAALTGALAFGMGWPAAIAAGLGIAVNAMGMHEATKAMGAALFKPQPISYKPSPFRAAASIVLPPPTLRGDDERR